VFSVVELFILPDADVEVEWSDTRIWVAWM
jgi:hypothetical protein